MKRIFLLLASVMMSSTTWAGVRNIAPAEATVIESVSADVRGPEHWTATVRRGDEKPVEVRNLGDRFASVLLRRGEAIEVCVTIPGLPSGERVQIASTHGGTVDGRPRVEWTTREIGRAHV